VPESSTFWVDPIGCVTILPTFHNHHVLLPLRGNHHRDFLANSLLLLLMAFIGQIVLERWSKRGRRQWTKIIRNWRKLKRNFWFKIYTFLDINFILIKLLKIWPMAFIGQIALERRSKWGNRQWTKIIRNWGKLI
jgi:hypothetical protein